MIDPHYKRAFLISSNFAKEHNISLIKTKEGKYAFVWEKEGKKYALINKKASKPEGIDFAFTADLNKLPRIYLYQDITLKIKKYANEIVNEYFNYNKYGCIEHKENYYTLTKENNFTLGYKKSEIDFFDFLSAALNVKKEPLIAYLQNKFNFEEKYPFYKIDVAKLEEVGNAFESQKTKMLLNNKYFPLLLNEIRTLYCEHLMSDEAKNARKYLYARGLSKFDIEYNELGYGFADDVLLGEKKLQHDIYFRVKMILTPDEKKEFENWVASFKEHFPLGYLGLHSQTEKGRFDLMAHRITFPIRNENGEIVAFSGRFPGIPKENSPKYLNTKTSLLWQKSNNVFNLDFAEENLRNNKNLFVVEGLMDSISLNKIGIPSVALMGVTCSDKQVELIKKLNAEKIYISLDFDQAGKLNEEKVREAFVKNNVTNVELFNKPEVIKAKDFDEFINKKDGNDKSEVIMGAINPSLTKSYEDNEMEVGG